MYSAGQAFRNPPPPKWRRSRRKRRPDQLTADQRAEVTARHRLELVGAYATLLLALGRNRAARRLERSRTTLDRHLRAYTMGGFEALKPKTARCGSRALITFEECLTPAVTHAVRELAVKTGAVALAWREFARSPACPARIASHFAARSYVPTGLIRAVDLRRHTFTVWTGPGHFMVMNPETLFTQ